MMHDIIFSFRYQDSNRLFFFPKFMHVLINNKYFSHVDTITGSHGVGVGVVHSNETPEIVGYSYENIALKGTHFLFLFAFIVVRTSIRLVRLFLFLVSV